MRLRAFAKLLPPAVFRQAAQAAEVTLRKNPLNWANMVWLGLAAALDTGKSFADPWVIATAHTNGCAVVTGENATGNPDRPKIPDVCRGMGIRCIGFVDLIREEQWRF